MTYSLMEPLQKILGVEIEGVEQMTGEHRLPANSFPFFSLLVLFADPEVADGWISLRLFV
jgi:hypothetical protein